MGAYLSRPKTEQITEKGENDRLKYAASCMQGWRTSQEDDHNCLLDFADNCALFAVYDGHGGSDVSKYTAQHFGNMLKPKLPASLDDKDQMEKLLKEVFIEFDEHLRSAAVMSVLRKLAGKPPVPDKTELEADGVEDRQSLVEEATLPLDQLLEKYGVSVEQFIKGQHQGKRGKRGKKQRSLDKHLSPMIRPKPKREESVNGLATEDSAAKKLDLDDAEAEQSEDEEAPELVAPQEKAKTEKDDVSEEAKVDSATNKKRKSTDQTEGDGDAADILKQADVKRPKTEAESAVKEDEPQSLLNGHTAEHCRIEELESKHKPNEESTKSEPMSVENGAGDTVKKEEDSAVQEGIVSENGAECEQLSAGSSKAKHVPKDTDAASDSSSEGEGSDMSGEDNDDEDQSDSDSDSSALDDSDDDDEEDGDESGEVQDEATSSDEYEADREDEEMMGLSVPTGDTPGEDSGTTACIALMTDSRVYVANIGDSRAVLCRGGKAIDLSLDHKPEDEIERKRIEAAGGRITEDGRVNGGLNLSRAFGDHFYKKCASVSLAEQMISALPDVTCNELQPDDSFMLIACDGIWNSLSSQQVVDFVDTRLKQQMPITTICEKLCCECLADSTEGDGTGCDNMTVLIALRKHNQTNGDVEEVEGEEGAQPLTNPTGNGNHANGDDKQ